MDLATSLNNIGDVYLKKKLLNEALDYFNRSLKITEKDAPGSLIVAESLNNLGELYKEKKDLDKSLSYYQRALEIRKKDSPDSLAVASSLNDIGNVYQDKGQLDKALKFSEDALKLRMRLGYLVDDHPDLVGNYYNICQITFGLENYGKAVQFALNVISKDREYKFAYNILGQALVKQGKLDEAVKVFDDVLKIDPNYSDDAIHKVETLNQITSQERDQVKKAKLIRETVETFKKTSKVQKSDFNQKLIAKQKENAKKSAAKVSEMVRRQSLNPEDAKNILESIANVNVELPKEEYPVGSKEFHDQIARLEKIIMAQGQKIDKLESRVDRLEDRIDILDGKVYGLQHSMEIVNQDLAQINSKIDDNSSNQELLKDLRVEKRKSEDRSKAIKEFNQNCDLADYYHNLLSEMTAFYVAAQAVNSGQINKSKSESYSTVAGYIATAVSTLPAFGELASKVIEGIGYAADLKHNLTETRNLKRLAELTPSVSEFDQIALRVAVNATKYNIDKIKSLNGAQIPTD